MYRAFILLTVVLFAHPVQAATDSGMTAWMFGGQPAFPTSTYPEIAAPRIAPPRTSAQPTAPDAQDLSSPSLLFAVYPVDMRVMPSAPLIWPGVDVSALTVALDLRSRPIALMNLPDGSGAAAAARAARAQPGLAARVLRKLRSLPGGDRMVDAAPLAAGGLLLVVASFGTGLLVARGRRWRRSALRRARRSAEDAGASSRKRDWVASPSPLAVVRESQQRAMEAAAAPFPAQTSQQAAQQAPQQIGELQLLLAAQKLAETLLQTHDEAASGARRSGRSRGRSRRRTHKRVSYSGT
ncbi:hypothetical protein [Rhodobaculum claviforme]|uniref:Uncharacterized protein n=1 Tax=Rhodobaculum claviforme TaxID=1549854 RepID=A0A934WIU0_9RHOB|nr:hypothetical protein [Rhodobaculum claviforme]MBK5927164.1 hypothetical protein [Rhodobaculum claviforme]